MRSPRRWSNEETIRLQQAVTTQLNKLQPETSIDWTKIADAVQTRNNKECRKRWYYVCNPGITKGSWTLAEDARLRAAVHSQGRRWAEVSRLVSTRNPDQCAKRYHEALKPNISKDRWTLHEDDVLLKAVQLHGNSWIEIAERYFPDRTPLGVRNRFTFHERRGQTDPPLSELLDSHWSFEACQVPSMYAPKSIPSPAADLSFGRLVLGSNTPGSTPSPALDGSFAAQQRASLYNTSTYTAPPAFDWPSMPSTPQQFDTTGNPTFHEHSVRNSASQEVIPMEAWWKLDLAMFGQHTQFPVNPDYQCILTYFQAPEYWA